MAKSAPTLDTPFRRGEKVLTTRALGPHPEGSQAKVKLINGFDPWIRYWVRFADGEIVGQVSHIDLVRPSQVDEWHARAAAQAEAALRDESAASGDAPAAEGGGGGGDGIASQIPAAILERSKAAKARLLGG
ncbi:MAG: hypothetical protein R2710_09855 [Acidimicrobiales bacterium]